MPLHEYMCNIHHWEWKSGKLWNLGDYAMSVKAPNITQEILSWINLCKGLTFLEIIWNFLSDFGQGVSPLCHLSTNSHHINLINLSGNASYILGLLTSYNFPRILYALSKQEKIANHYLFTFCLVFISNTTETGTTF